MSFRQLHYGKLQRQFTGTKNYIPSVVGNPKDYNMLMYLTKEKKVVKKGTTRKKRTEMILSETSYGPPDSLLLTINSAKEKKTNQKKSMIKDVFVLLMFKIFPDINKT